MREGGAADWRYATRNEKYAHKSGAAAHATGEVHTEVHSDGTVPCAMPCMNLCTVLASSSGVAAKKT